MFRMEVEPQGNVVHIEARGRLTSEDYDQVLPEIEGLIAERGALRFVLDLTEMDGLDVGGVVKDLAFDIKHRNDYERVAIVGDETWQRWMTTLSQPLARGEMRYFPVEERDAAESWIHEA